MNEELESIEAASLAAAYEVLGQLLLHAPGLDGLSRIASAFDGKEGEMGRFASWWSLLGEDERGTECSEVTAEFSRLLLGMSANPLLPYESAYVDATPDPLKSARHVVSREYADRGFKVSEETSLCPDHAGIELCFVAELLKAGHVHDASRFFDGHVRTWLPRLASDMESRAKTRFYRALAASIMETCA